MMTLKSATRMECTVQSIQITGSVMNPIDSVLLLVAALSMCIKTNKKLLRERKYEIQK
jgi:hypothetical protein